jgi:hypothetical protein
VKRVCLLLGLSAVVCGGPAFALDLDPTSRAKAIASAAPASAPAVNLGRNQLPDLHGGLDSDGRTFSGACSTGKTDLCYDYREGRMVIRSTRNWMPEIGDLTPEHISVRKDRINFRYSFR